MDTLSVSITNSTNTGVLVTRRVTQMASLLGILMAVLAIVSFTAQVWKGMTLFAVSDEVEYYLIGRLLHHGRHLYGDVFSHHGPLQHLVAHFYASWISESDFSYIRLWQVILAGVSCASLYFSPALQTKSGRVWAAAVYILLLSFVWNVEGFNDFLYYTMGGLLLAPLVTQYVVPLMLDREPAPFWLFVSGAATSASCFCAYSNGATLLFLILSPLPCFLLEPNRQRIRSYIRPLGLGMVAVAAVVGLWILRYGDLKGYLIYHFYFNQQIYKDYIGFTFVDFLKNFSFSFAPEAIIHGIALSLDACSVYMLVRLQNGASTAYVMILRMIALGLVATGVVLANPRAEASVVDAGFVNVSLVLFALSGACFLDRFLIHRVTLGIVNAMLMFGGALFITSHVEGYAMSPLGVPGRELTIYTDTMKPSQDAIYDFIRTITKDDGDLLALNYNDNIFLKADRLPVSGHLFYLPWQAAYYRHPIDGYKADICADIRTYRPAVIWFFNWRVGKYSLDDYEPCILALITEGYVPLKFDSPWHIRNDLYQNALSKLPADADTSINLGPMVPKILRLGTPLTPFTPIEMMMSPTHLERRVVLRRIGILMGTYDRQNGGEAELRLRNPEGGEDSRIFLLSELENNRYHFFDIEPGVYIAGEIRSVTGEGISAWESHLVNSASYTCLIYEYVDNTRRYTPACPIM